MKAHVLKPGDSMAVKASAQAGQQAGTQSSKILLKIGGSIREV